jgi:hypothetical protein
VVMSQRSAGRWALLAVAGLLATGTVSCTDEPTASTAEPTRSPRPVPNAEGTELGPDMSRYMADAERANVEGPDTLHLAGARWASVGPGSEDRPLLRDEDRSDWQAGTYRLVVYCAGTGTLSAHFQIGKWTQVAQLPACSPEVTTGTVDLAVTSDTVGSTVTLTPVGEVKAAAAYQVQRQ